MAVLSSPPAIRVRASGASSGRVRSLDAVRGLAALAIATLHAAGVAGGSLPGRTGGFVSTMLECGLAVFFVLSGYLIAGPFVRALVDGEAMPGLRGYALRRAMRIGPGYWIAFIVTALVISAEPLGVPATLTWSNAHLQAGDWAASLLFGQDLVPSLRGAGVLPVMWTLCAELVFYTAVPLLAVAVARRRRGRALAPAQAVLGVMVVWAAAALLQSQLGAIGRATGNPGLFTAMMVSYLSLFCPGVLLAIAGTRAASLRWRRVLDLLGRREVRDFGPLAAVLAAVGTYALYRAAGGDLGLTPAGEWRRQPAALAAMVLVALALSARGRLWQLCVRRLAPLGTISYGIYLYHWVVLRMLVDRHVFPLPVPGWATILCKVGLALLLTLPLAALSWVLIERPAIRFAGRAGGQPRRRRARQISSCGQSRAHSTGM